MIIDAKKVDLIEESPSVVSTKMGISIDNEAAIIEIVVGFYKNKPESIIREWCSNGIDSRTESGILDKPVIAKLYRKQDGWFFSVQDFGLGINQETVDTILSQFGKSTKLHSNELLGAYGLGNKSAFSYTTHYTLKGVKNGIEGFWIFKRSEQGFSVDCIYNDKPTTDPNGATFEVKLLNNYNEPSIWTKAIKEQLAYFKNVFIINEYQEITPNYKIYETAEFKFSELNTDNNMHLCLNDVYYPIDFKYLGIDPINIPIALKFSLEDGITPLPARESYYNVEKTKNIILDKIKLVANWMVTEYNKQDRPEFDSFLNAYNTIINTGQKTVKLAGKTLNINPLLKYADLKIADIVVKGYDSKYLKKIATNFRNILRHYFYVVGYIKYNGSVSKNFKSLYEDSKIVLVKQLPKGKLREYLKTNEPKDTIFAKIDEDIPLFREKSVKKIIQQRSWYRILDLNELPKKEWRKIITQSLQVVNEVIKNAKDYRDFVVPASFKLSKTSSSHYKGLDKKEGDITLAYARKSFVGSSIIFEKEPKPLKTLYKLNYLTIYGTSEDKDKLAVIHRIFKACGKRHTTAIVGPREIKKILNIHNFKTIDQFMKLPLMARLIASQEAANILENLEMIKKKSTVISVFKEIYHKHIDLINFATDYQKKYENLGELVNNEVFQEMRDFLIQNNALDKEFVDKTAKFKDLMESIKFVQFLEYPLKSYNESNESFIQRKKEYLSLVYKIMLFEKLHNNGFKDFKISVKYNQNQ